MTRESSSFTANGYTVELAQFYARSPFYAFAVGRTDENGNFDTYIVSEELQKAYDAATPEQKVSHHRTFYIEGEVKTLEEHYFILANDNPLPAGNLSELSAIGCVNTSIVLEFEHEFLFPEDNHLYKFVLPTTVNTGGTYAMYPKDVLENDVERHIEDFFEEHDDMTPANMLDKFGIATNEDNDDADLIVYAIDQDGLPIDFETDSYELQKAYIGSRLVNIIVTTRELEEEEV